MIKFQLKGGCDLTRGTRGKTHLQAAFKLAHLAAGGRLNLLSGEMPAQKKARFTVNLAFKQVA